MEKKQLAITVTVLLVGLFIGYTLLVPTIDRLKVQIAEKERELAEKDEIIESQAEEFDQLNDKLNRVLEKLTEKDRIIESLIDHIGSGFEHSKKRDSDHLSGEIWDTINHYFEVHKGVVGGWSVQDSVSLNGTNALEMVMFDGGTERARIEFRIREYGGLFDEVMYVSMWYKLPSDWKADHFYVFAELARERPVIGSTELAIELGFWRNPESSNEWWFVLQQRDLQRDTYVNGEREKHIHYREFLRPIILGEWFHVEWYLRRHSTNGEVRVWIDGDLLADRRNEMTKTQDYYYVTVMRIYTSMTSPFPQYLWGDDLIIRVPKVS